jgi:putative transposase
MPQSLHAVGVHLVFSTKGRHPWIQLEFASDMHAYMSRILQNMECRSITVGGYLDHVHILMNITKKVAPVTVIEVVKKDSSKFAKRLSPRLEEFGWQTGYAMFGVSQSHIPAVQAYIGNQERHHKGESFQDEFRRLLDESGMEYDERYVWD